MNIAAIETRYSGYRFRSRLEARWAVFFEECREQYVYEHEGFRLPSGFYLPDFYFPKRNAFLEVKPLNQLPRRNFEFDSFKRQSWAPIDDNFSRELILAFELSRGLKLADGHCVVVYGDPLDVLEEDGGAVCVTNRGLECTIGFIDLFPSLLEPADAARAARFEHGA